MISIVLAVVLQANIVVQPGNGIPGDIVLFTVTGADAVPSGTFGTRPLTFYASSTGHWALAAVPVETQAGEIPYVVITGSADGDGIASVFEVREPHFAADELTVSRKFTQPSAAQKKRSRLDQLAFDQAFKSEPVPWTFVDSFSWPRPLDVTAQYGERRMFNGKQKSQHMGIDLDGRTGDPITAANDGIVVMVRDCFGSGKTVIIHHGGQLFTTYFHMSAFETSMGKRVKRGERIGRVGKTGRVTGPHLHFGIKLAGEWLNPSSLLALEF